ncbi:MAG: hypothetical protein U0R64_08460 [Candidatus Nanopelagicales bacterium]
MKPQPRPALKRAEDADLHPALSVAPAQVPPRLVRDPAVTPAATEPATGKAPRKPDGKAGKGKKKGKNKAASDRPYQSGATSDVLRHGKQSNKQVQLKVTVPKRVRTELRAIAEQSGTPLDQIVGQALAEWLGDPRRW